MTRPSAPAPSRTTFARVALVFLILGVIGGTPRGALAAPTADGGPEEVFDEVWNTVRDHFFDPDLSGLDWNEVRERYRPLARSSGGGRPLHRLINRMLGELGVSHTGIIEKEVYRDCIGAEFKNRKVLLVGLELVRLEDGYFVRSILEGGAAEKAGIRRGDRVVSIDGTRLEDSPLFFPAGSDPGLPGPPEFFIGASGADPIRIGIRRTPVGDREKGIAVVPESMNQIEAIRRSVRVVERDGLRLGVIHLRHLMSRAVARILERAIERDFAEVDGLVVDLRGRGGAPAVAMRVLRALEGFDRPLVGVIDGHSRSAKEVVAHRMRDRRIGTLVGERTQGAVLGGRFYQLSDGSVLMLATSDVDVLTDGVHLEGVGVPPHVWIEDRVRYANGEDPLLDRALEVAVARARGLPLSRRKWY